MNERLVEDWLTKASERSFQTPFAQALLAEGMAILRVGHSAHEHGKDIIAVDRDRKVHAYHPQRITRPLIKHFESLRKSD